MPVGTAATVKAMTADAVRSTGAGIVLGNTYHLMLRPGAERVAALGGLHRMMDWPGPILTDSGGFQIMSLAKLRTLDADGVTFASHVDGSRHRLTPERSVAIQHALDATITMALDECTPFPATHDQAQASMELSMRWAARCAAAFTPRDGYGLFGIVQGGVHADLRRASADAIAALDTAGIAVGGLAVGEGQPTMFEVLEATVPHLPPDKPRYLMGVGTPDDLLGAVLRGIDMFDCVIPTRAGRTARAYTSRGILNLRNARFRRRCRPARSVMLVPGLRPARARLSASPVPLRGNARADAADLAQHPILPRPDGRHARRHHGRPTGGARRRGPRRLAGDTMSDLSTLTQLGQPVTPPDSPDSAVLERVPNPDPGSIYVVRFVAPEFTSLCPITGQPDFAHLVIDYVPREWLVESKSLKLFLGSFRNHGGFHEGTTMTVAKRLVAALDPVWLRIGGYWYPRGGIPIDVFFQTGAPPEGAWIPDQGVASYRGRG